MRRILLVFLLPAALLGAAHIASGALVPPAPREVVASRRNGILSAQGPVLFAAREARVRAEEGILAVLSPGLAPFQAPLPAGARVAGLRLFDLDRDGRDEIFVLLEFSGDTLSPRVVEEWGFAFVPASGEIIQGHLVAFLQVPLLIDGKALAPMPFSTFESDSSSPPMPEPSRFVWEEIYAYAPAEAPAGVYPDLVLSRARNLFPRNAPNYTPAYLAKAVGGEPLRLAFDRSIGAYRSPEPIRAFGGDL